MPFGTGSVQESPRVLGISVHPLVILESPLDPSGSRIVMLVTSKGYSL